MATDTNIKVIWKCTLLRKKPKRIRAYLRKSKELCSKCKYNMKTYCLGTMANVTCNECEMWKKQRKCYCDTIENGEPCKHFERRELQKGGVIK